MFDARCACDMVAGMNTNRLNMAWPENIYRRLRVWARNRGVTLSSAVRMIVSEHLLAEEKQRVSERLLAEEEQR
jgi:macrodomain Ter protein organizer (MatP/YcbG family)